MVGLRKVVAESILAFMGRFFFIEAKTFEFIIEPWGNAIWLRIVEQGKGYLRSIVLEKGGVAWLLSMLGEVVEEENVKFIRKFRDSSKAFLGMRSNNSHGSYLVFEEFNGGGRTGFIIIPEGKNK